MPPGPSSPPRSPTAPACRRSFTGGTPPVLASLTPQLSLAAGATFTWTVQALVLSNGIPASGQSVAWQTSVERHRLARIAPPPSPTPAASPPESSPSARSPRARQPPSPRLPQRHQPVRRLHRLRRAPGVRHPPSRLRHNPEPLRLRNHPPDHPPPPRHGRQPHGRRHGRALYQALYAWAPPCAPHGVCAQAPLLATQSATATSALDGTVTFTPASLPGVATNLLGLAATGNTATSTSPSSSIRTASP
jgi:hypothetical protein